MTGLNLPYCRQDGNQRGRVTGSQMPIKTSAVSGTRLQMSGLIHVKALVPGCSLKGQIQSFF